ncbi:MAG: hypothetical protein FWC09_05280 [Lachnospiraceae bacterium]|nr:hypothetical protein [Lachnospiraceae bacterium]
MRNKQKMIGFIAFWIAVGMLVMFFLVNRFVALIIISLLLLIGYNFYFSSIK